MGDFLKRVGQEFSFGGIPQGPPIQVGGGWDPNSPPITITPDGRISGLPGAPGVPGPGTTTYQPKRPTFISAFLSSLPSALMQGVAASRGPGGGFATGLAGGLYGAQQRQDQLGLMAQQREQQRMENALALAHERRAQAEFEQHTAAGKEDRAMRRWQIEIDPKTGKAVVFDKQKAVELISAGQSPEGAFTRYGVNTKEDADLAVSDIFKQAGLDENTFTPQEKARLALAKKKAMAGGDPEPIEKVLKDIADNHLTERGQNITARGQNMADARARELNAIAREAKLNTQQQAGMTRLAATESELDRLAAAANELKNHPGLGGITGIPGALPNIPGGAAANAEAKLNTLKSQVAFGVLQNMRNNSKTGGALGQVSDKEGKLLESNLAALEKSQSKEEFQQSLQKIIDYTDKAKDRMRTALERQYGVKVPPADRGTAGGAASPPSGNKVVDFSRLPK